MAHRWDPKAQPVEGLVRPVCVDPDGQIGPTRGQTQCQTQGARWRRTTPGLFVPSSISDGRVEQRILEQSMRITGSGAVTGWAALRLHGGNFFDGLESFDGRTRLPVPIIAGSDRMRAHEDIVLTRERLLPSEVLVLHGIRCTTIERALFDEMRRTGLVREGAVSMDMAAAAELTSLLRMRSLAGSRARFPRLPLVREALGLAAEGSRSPQESRFRMIWELDAGWPRPLLNRAVFGLDGTLLGVPDLLDPDLGVVGEYDGADHRAIDRHTRDVRREDLFRRAGLEYVEVVGRDLRDPGLVVDRMNAARERAGSVPRRWMLDLPGPHPAELSLDDRLDMRDLVRADLGR